jgi:Sugar kinases, ribokinase family
MEMIDVACIGVVLMDLPLGPLDEQIFREETTMVDQIALTTGGDAFNEAIILARLGKRPALMGQVGDDLLGEIIEKRCDEEGVEHSRLQLSKEAKTRINVVIVGKDGQRHFIKTLTPGSGSFHPEDMDFDFIKKARAVSLASLFCSKLKDSKTVLQVLKTAKDNKLITFADMVPMAAGESLEDISGALQYLDYFLPNLEEAEMLTGLENWDEMADSLLSYGVKNVVIKLGKEGCLIKNREERFLIPAFPARAIDTTGAGDNFAAGFISAVLDGSELKDCGVFANAVAAASTECVGAVGGVVDRRQIEARIRQK